ncbi:MAG: amidophosphoribosyltransferase [Candidatus Levybacteria bacterium]|nr:amidophosphoribosyltransferase [Candidatus Levybacteria bacterium]
MSSPEFPNYLEIDKPRDYCAVVGVVSFVGHDVAEVVRLALHDQQNRGEDGAGIATFSAYTRTFRVYKDVGLVAQAFPEGKLEEEELAGSLATGHTRYATSGSKEDNLKDKSSCLQPYVVGFNKQSLALSHNGNIPEKYLARLRSELPPGVPLQSDTDSEIIAWRILFAKGDSWREKVINGLNGVVGAYSLVIATDEGDLFGVKDPRGIRPLVFARTQNGAALVSESRGLEHIRGVIEAREVGAGEMVHITREGNIRIDKIFPEMNTARCVVEPIYLKHPYSKEGDREVREIREKMGEALAREITFPQDYTIVGVPDSGIEIAEGYARALGRRTEHWIKKDRYRPGRSFISQSEGRRDEVLELKFTISDSVSGRRIVIIDDSVIRGKTTKRLIASLRERGAAEVHVLSGSPMFIDICDLGVDIATLEELVALGGNGGNEFLVKTEEQIATEEIGADSIHYLSLDGLIEAIGGKKSDFCTNCLTRLHPIASLGESLVGVYGTNDLAREHSVI